MRPYAIYQIFNTLRLWKKINEKSSLKISAQDVILSNKLNETEVFIISTVSYFIFKEWLKYSFDNIPRKPMTAIDSLIGELKYVIKIYSSLNCTEECKFLQMMLDSLI